MIKWLIFKSVFWSGYFRQVILRHSYMRVPAAALDLLWATPTWSYQKPLWSCCKSLWHEVSNSRSDMRVQTATLIWGFQQPLWHEGSNSHSDMRVPTATLIWGFQQPLWYEGSNSHSDMRIPTATLTWGFQQPLWYEGSNCHSDMRVPTVTLIWGFQQPLWYEGSNSTLIWGFQQSLWYEGSNSHSWYEGSNSHCDLRVPTTIPIWGFQQPLWSCCTPLWHEGRSSHSEAAERRLSYHVNKIYIPRGWYRQASREFDRLSSRTDITNHNSCTSGLSFSYNFPLVMSLSFCASSFCILSTLESLRKLAETVRWPSFHVPQQFDSRWMVLHQISYREAFTKGEKQQLNHLILTLYRTVSVTTVRESHLAFPGSCLFIDFHILSEPNWCHTLGRMRKLKTWKFFVTFKILRTRKRKSGWPGTSVLLGILATALKFITMGTPRGLQ